ncbi:MAG: hypothetical protein K0R30_2947 [Ornithinibacter sp.]|jgi:hypothetical protein|nr:hypothetical protein [Ornithinibacter sp.]
MPADPTTDAARRPAYAHPDLGYDYDEDGEKSGISAGWDLAFGCRVSFNLHEAGDLYASVQMSDEPRRNGGMTRAVTREQIRGFAYYLIQMTEELDEFEEKPGA